MPSEKKFNTIRLTNSSHYERPEKTITDALQENQGYKDKLKNYEEVDNIDYVSISTHVRYFIFCNKSHNWKFRCGGILTYKHPKYVVLSNGKHSWSVQREVAIGDNEEIYETKFFKILSANDKKTKTIENQQKQIEDLKSDNEKMASQLKTLMEYIQKSNIK